MAPTNIVTLTIKEEMVEQFIAVAMEDSRASLENENGGCLRFDVLRDSLTPNKFIFYEMYKDEAAAVFHKTTPHYKMWSEFKASTGAVLTQEVSKCDAIFGAGL
ncbi:hypothetical protein T492DRAFT_1055497 [Pavlovales sp. CCMP2436]|nr:hypothetical protein T492DRAFT_1055497 [Pavlovales sp. CCMP2436]